MGLFSNEDLRQCRCRGTWDWPTSGARGGRPRVTGAFLEKDASGTVRTVSLSCDDRAIYLESPAGPRALELSLTVL
jgi:hypothetical protein